MDNILISFEYDNSLQKVVSDLESIENADTEVAKKAKASMEAYNARNKNTTDGLKQTASEIENLSADFKKLDKIIVDGAYRKALMQLQKQVEGTGDEFKQLSLVVDFAKKKLDGLKPNTPEWKQLNDQIETSEALLQTFAKGTENTTKQTKSLRSQLRDLKQDIAAALESTGGKVTPEIQMLIDKAGELDDTMKDINTTVANVGSDTRNLDGLISLAGAGVGVFSTFQGIIALTGDENDEFQQSLLKLNAAMAVLQGLQQVQNALQKESAASQLILNAQKKIGVLTTQLEAAAESKNIIVRNAAVVAQRALNAVMAANPATVLIVGIGALAGALALLTGKAKETTDQMALLNAELERQDLLLSRGVAQIDQATKLQLAEAKKRGASETEIKDLTVAGYQNQAKEYEASLQRRVAKAKQIFPELGNFQVKNVEELENALVDLKTIEAGLGENVAKGYKTKIDMGKQLLQKGIEDLKAYNAAKAAAEDAELNFEISEADKARQKQKEDADKSLQLRARELKAQFELLKDSKQREINFLNTQANAEIPDYNFRAKALNAALVKEEELIIAGRNFQLNSEKLTASERLVIIAQADDAILQKRNEYALRLGQIQTSIRNSEKQLLEETTRMIQGEAAKQAAALEKVFKANVGGNESQMFAEIRTQLTLYQQGLISREEYEKRKADIQNKYNRADLQAEAEYIGKVLQIDGLADDVRITAEQRLYDIKKQLRALDLKDQEDSANKSLETDRKTAELKQQLTQATFQLLQSVSDTFFAAEQQQIQNDLNQKLESIQKQRDFELSATGLTEEQKARITKRYQKEEAEAKRKAAKEEKESKRQQALMNGFLAVTNALATVQPFIPNALIAAGLAAAMTAIQVANISSTQVPQFAKGTKKAPAGYKWVGEKGPELIYDGGGYPIIPHQQSMKLADKNFFDPAIMQSYNIPMPKPFAYAGAILSDEQMKFIENHYHTSTTAIDYDKLATAIASKLGEQIERIPQTGLSIDEEGFTAYQRTQNELLIYKNKKLEI